MKYIEQYHTEFDRILKLIKKTLRQKFSKFSFNYFNLIEDDWGLLNLYEKINILTPIITAKNEKGEWILKEGGIENPKYKFKIKTPKINSIKAYINMSVFPADGIAEALKEEWDYISVEPKTLRDLFRTNCIPANDDEQDRKQIENLKLIKW